MGRTTKFQPRRHLSQIPTMDCTRFMRRKEIAEKMLRPVGGGRPHRFPVESGRGLYPKSSGGSKAPLFVFLSRYPFLFIIPCLFCFLLFPFHATTFHSTKFSVSHDVFRTPPPPTLGVHGIGKDVSFGTNIGEKHVATGIDANECINSDEGFCTYVFG